jgi:muramidase (phage lysozyme)
MAGTTNILGLIQRGEGNYNSVVGAVNSGLDLSQYSVSGVRAAFPTGALGAYQVTSGTWAAATRGIDPNAQFTPAVQDQMAINLSNARGLQDYNNGTLRIEVRGFNQDQQLQFNFSKIGTMSE